MKVFKKGVRTISFSKLTPRQIKEAFYKAAETDDAALALAAAHQFKNQKLWTSTPHYEPIEPDGSETLMVSLRPGTCVLCHVEFSTGTQIRWRSRVDCHAECWDRKYQNEEVSALNRKQA